ncbi:MAG: SsrA-binding protein SmpB [Anaerolineales bacterium]|jgi:SsrA-binding protein
MSIKVIATNRKARHNFYIIESFEAGIALLGSEIKSVRSRQVSIAEAYVRIQDFEAWLIDSHIAPYEQAGNFNHEPTRPRKLLLHKKEILRLQENVIKKGVTVIPLRLYLKNGLAKVEIAIARGKKLYDKRQSIKKRDLQREIDREFRKGGFH